jgi:DNA-binding IclR family transcriptional regulator
MSPAVLSSQDRPAQSGDEMARGQQQGIKSLEIGIRLFQELHRLSQSATLSELARLSGMPPGKVHRYCVSLIRTGLMQQDGRGLYGIGPYGFQLSHAPSNLELARKLAAAALPRLVRQIDETAFISSWGQKGPVILTVVDAPKQISIRPNWRGDLPLWNSATGRAFAAFLPSELLEPLINDELSVQARAAKLSRSEVASRKRAFVRHLADVRKYRVARTTGERYPGIVSFAAPIFDCGGAVILAITCFGLATTLASSWQGQVPQALKLAAQELTRRIGGQSPE